jgi:hypothetical protein
MGRYRTRYRLLNYVELLHIVPADNPNAEALVINISEVDNDRREYASKCFLI